MSVLSSSPWVANFVTGFVRDKDGRAVAAVYGGNVDYFNDEVGIARTRLISAAPELLAALELVALWDFNHDRGLSPSVLETVEAAIAKAVQP